MNILQQLSKAKAKVDIIETSVGYDKEHSDALRKSISQRNKERYARSARRYEGKTISEWAKHYGVTNEAIQGYIKRRGVPHPLRGKALTAALQAKAKLYDGKPVTYWAKHYGVDITTIYQRIRLHNDPHPGCKTKAWRQGHGVKIEGKTVEQWAEHYGVHITTIYNRLNTNGTPHKRKR